MVKKGRVVVGFGLATKGGAVFGLESGSGSLLFLALPLQWVAGALLIFFSCFYWVLVALHVFSAGGILVFDVL